MSAYKNLVFFNKEGDYLNFKYDPVVDRFDGSLIFHENSTDTYKTIGIYALERIPSFEFESPGELSLNKFQLFNEYGLFFYRAGYENQQIDSVQSTNNDPSFYSKWIYGDNFEAKFPLGTVIIFNSQLLEFTNLTQTYTVIGSRKGAIMVITATDNATFENTYFEEKDNPFTYEGKTISAINAIGVYNYIDNSYLDNLSTWNEPSFYDKLYPRKKLNVVNSNSNDGIYTVLDENLTDNRHYEYFTSGSPGNDIIIELISKTDLPKIYDGGMNITSDSKIYLTSGVPKILKPGVEFKIINSNVNTNFYTVSPLPTFFENTSPTFYDVESQVVYNNKIYQCILAYTQSFDGEFYLVNPDNTVYWTPNTTYVKVDQGTSVEVLTTAQLYLTTDRLYFGYGFTVSNAVTLASAAEKYKEDLLSFNVDLYYKNNLLKADLVYPTKYVEVNFYHTQVGATYSITGLQQVNERLVRVTEKLIPEINYDYSERLSYKIVFTDLDLYGFKLVINKEIYQEELAPIYSGGVYDVPRTIDRTLRNWLARYYTELIRIGINAEIVYVGSIYSPFVNAIRLTSTYPNVPMQLNNVLIGSTGDYYIEHSTILFNQDVANNFYGIGSFVNININGEDFEQLSEYQTGTYSSYPDIPSTLQSWVKSYSQFLETLGIYVSSVNNLLKFDIKDMSRRVDYTIQTGKLTLPGQSDYTITKKIKGNLGCLVTSNEVTLPITSGYSFEEVGFATGMVFSINNTIYPYDNQEYNIQLVDPNVMNLSYQGPFWGLTSGICDSSAFITLAFSVGFGQTACPPFIGPTGLSASGGPFNSLPGGAFNTSAFSLSFNPNTYILNSYDLSTFPGTTGLVDLIYVQLSNSIYAFGDNLVVMDSYLSSYINTISLPGNTQSIELEFNTFNNYLYCLSKGLMYVVDPLINYVVATMSFTYSAFDLEINPINGDVYVTYENSPRVDIYDYTNTLVETLTPSSTNFPPLATSCGKMVFNEFEQDMYITTDKDVVMRVNGGGIGNATNRTIQTTYTVPGLTSSIFYEPANEAVYVYGSASLFKIDNGVTYSLSITTQGFEDVIYNNLTNQMNISDSSTLFRALDLSSNSVSISSGVSNYGYLALNQFDGDVYLSSLSLNNIIVIRPTTGAVVHTESLSSGTTKIIYNPDRQSVWAIQPSSNSIIELDVELNSSIIINPPLFGMNEDNQYGTLDPNYEPHPDVWLKAKEYVRRPRENFEGEPQVTYYWRWISNQVPQMFFYDFSGEQLPITGSYAYTGVKPLEPAILNKFPNKDLTKVSRPEYQQTIFDRVYHKLSYIDDEDDLQVAPTPLQVFLGFKSESEGALRNAIQLMRQEYVDIYFETTKTNGVVLTFETLDISGPDKRGRISINALSNEFFTGKNLKEGQLIVLYIKDITNQFTQYISNNNGIIVKIRSVFSKSIIVDFLNPVADLLSFERTALVNYPTNGATTYLSVRILVVDKEIGRFIVYGQTEEEDIRFKIELGNQGKLIEPNDVFIFKEYDILEGGIDWIYLNQKRKEMLLMKSMIFPYIGAYKSIINAINFFGYNDLQLNEYYRDINPDSLNFLKLFKVEIPDIFDNSVEGWTETEYIKNNFPNENFEGQNSFNLTYKITDKDGVNVLSYSVDEIIIKLQGLKYWLKRNIIPLTHKILDITGQSYFSGGTQISHTTYDVRHFNFKENMTPITFKMNEAYLLPINSGSTVYNCVLDFYTILEGAGADKNPTGLVTPPRPYNGVEVVLPDYYSISIRTYKTYKEWAPFVTYNKGDKIIYFGKLYESAKGNNKINNPRRYDAVPAWTSNNVYDVSNIVKYQRDYYVFSGIAFAATASATASYVSTLQPLLDTGNWLNVTEWREIDYEPVQKISEFRPIPHSKPVQIIPGVPAFGATSSGFPSADPTNYSRYNPILPFNFTVDSNIDPFIVIEVTTDNGYGQTYTDKKSYEVRGLKDLREPTNFIDPIGPFEPIKPIY